MKPSWDQYFLGIADAASRRSSCERSKVGAAVVKHNRVRSLGYNDAPPGRPGCESCPRRLSDVQPGSCYETGAGRCVAIHAEQNAVIFSDREDLRGATIYITREACSGCMKTIQAAGIQRIVTPDGDQELP